MKDMTTRSFGLMIAYLLPGFSFFCSASFWSSEVRSLLRDFMSSNSDVGSFLFVVLLSLLFGLVLNAVRWFFYERHLPSKSQMHSDYFARVSESDRLLAIHTILDENFRYHQFYGSLSLVGCIFIAGVAFKGYTHFLKELYVSVRIGIFILALVLLGLLEIIIILAAKVAFRRYVERSKAIMKGGEHA